MSYNFDQEDSIMEFFMDFAERKFFHPDELTPELVELCKNSDGEIPGWTEVGFGDIECIISGKKVKRYENFFVPFLMVFRRFLSSSLPFKASLTTLFPSVPETSVAVYVVKKQSLIGFDQRGFVFECSNLSLSS